jgi:hypothetical protein
LAPINIAEFPSLHLISSLFQFSRADEVIIDISSPNVNAELIPSSGERRVEEVIEMNLDSKPLSNFNLLALLYTNSKAKGCYL